MLGRRAVKQLPAWVLIQAGGVGSNSHSGTWGCWRNRVSSTQSGLLGGTQPAWHRGDYQEEQNQLSTEILLLVFFHSTEQRVLGWSDTFVLIFWKGKKDSQVEAAEL